MPSARPCVQVEMYADPIARGGVLEPEGIVEIKFRAPDLVKAIHRLDPVIARIKAEDGPDTDAAIRAREAALLPVYRQVRVPSQEEKRAGRLSILRDGAGTSQCAAYVPFLHCCSPDGSNRPASRSQVYLLQ